MEAAAPDPGVYGEEIGKQELKNQTTTVLGFCWGGEQAPSFLQQPQNLLPTPLGSCLIFAPWRRCFLQLLIPRKQKEIPILPGAPCSPLKQSQQLPVFPVGLTGLGGRNWKAGGCLPQACLSFLPWGKETGRKSGHVDTLSWSRGKGM